MSELDLSGLVVVVAVAFARPSCSASSPRSALPSVVLEIVAGIVDRPLGASAGSRSTSRSRSLALIGLAFLLFLAGLEIDFERLRGRLLRLARLGFAVSFAIALVVALAADARAAWSRRRCSSRSSSCATSLGVIVPVLKDAGETSSQLRPARDRGRLDRRLRRDHPAVALLLRRGDGHRRDARAARLACRSRRDRLVVGSGGRSARGGISGRPAAAPGHDRADPRPRRVRPAGRLRRARGGARARGDPRRVRRRRDRCRSSTATG